MVDAPHDNFGYAADASIFRNLYGWFRSIYRRNLCTQLLCKMQIASQAL